MTQLTVVDSLVCIDETCRGPLIFCLLLSLLLSMTASSEQKTTVFSGVFALVWIGEAVVTMQIKLLGGNMSASDVQLDIWLHANSLQLFLPVHMHHWVHSLSFGHCRLAQCGPSSHHSSNTSLPYSHRMVFGCWYQYSRRLWSGEKSGWHRSISTVCFLCWAGLLVFHKLKVVSWSLRIPEG